MYRRAVQVLDALRQMEGVRIVNYSIGEFRSLPPAPGAASDDEEIDDEE